MNIPLQVLFPDKKQKENAVFKVIMWLVSINSVYKTSINAFIPIKFFTFNYGEV